MGSIRFSFKTGGGAQKYSVILLLLTKGVLHDLICLADELHITVFDSVVDHFDVVARSTVTNPVAAWLIRLFAFSVAHLEVHEWEESIHSTSQTECEMHNNRDGINMKSADPK